MGAQLPIDLEALKTVARPLPGMTDAERNHAVVRAQMRGTPIAGQMPATQEAVTK
jgi:hypothetical protein